jgi:ATP-binding cassette subfamily B protein
VSRNLVLWAELLKRSWRIERRTVVTEFAAQVALVAMTLVGALSLRDAVDAAIGHSTADAVLAAMATALSYALQIALRAILGNLRILLVEPLALVELQPEILRDIATLEGLDHLERTDFLDRTTVLRGAAWGVVDSLWGAVDAVFSVLQVAVALVLLGSVSPWLLLLLLFAMVPLVCEQRGLRAVKRAETDTAEQFRLQRHLFDTATSASAGKEIRVAGAAGELARRQSAAWDSAARGRQRARWIAAVWRLAGWALFTAGFVGGLALVIESAARGRAALGDVVMTVTVANNLRQSVHQAVLRGGDTQLAGRLIEPYLWLRVRGRRPCAHQGHRADAAGPAAGRHLRGHRLRLPWHRPVGARRHRPAHPGRLRGRRRRRVRFGQDHAGQAAVEVLPPGPRPDPGGRHRPGRAGHRRLARPV